MPRLQDQIRALMPPSLKAFIDGSARRDLLRKIDTTLVVFDNKVAHIQSGTIREFQANGQPLDPESLATASKALLGEAGTESSILLLVPPALFVATVQQMPGIDSDSIVSALQLQSEALLPANDDPLVLAINPLATTLSDEPTALWVRSDTLAGLYAAYAHEGLFIAAIKPRVLHRQSLNPPVLDADATTLTYVKSTQNVLMQWTQTDRVDLEQAEFQQQWQDALTDATGQTPIEMNSIEHYLDHADDAGHQEYSFFPQGALQARRQVEKGRKLMLAAAVVAAGLFLSSIPFLIQSVQFRSLAATLESQRELSVEARQDQAVVVAFENELGPINDFPEQRVREAMFNLQNALSPNRLSSLEITKGLINIQGTSAEPQSILQRLEQDPMFTEVAFSRATNNDRYYIGLRLSTVNFDAYMVRYFPDE